MNLITVSIIIIAAILAVIYMIIKNHCINKLTKSMKLKDYSSIIMDAQKPCFQKLLGEFNCDLFLIRAYYLMNDVPALTKKAIEMLNTEYKAEQKKRFLEIYYHIFLNKKDLNLANQFLNQIVKVDDNAFVKYNQYTYNVLVEKEDDLIDTMEVEINMRQYTGFALGTIVYLIGMQYLYKEDYANAELYFKECLSCFHPNAFYVDLAKQHIKYLNNRD